MKKYLFVALAIVMATSQVAFADFTDVSSSDRSATAITWLQDNGVVQGYDDGSFKPDNLVNRAEFLKMLYETTGMEGHEPILEFPDVEEDAWYYVYVKEAFGAKVAVGYPDGTFRPNSNINYAEASKIVMNAFFDVDDLYGDGSGFDPCLNDYSKDVSVNTDDWYWKFVFVAEELCVSSFESRAQNSSGLDPAENITRADMAELLYRAKTSSDNGDAKYATSIAPITVTTENQFDLTKIEEGDEFVDMAVVSVDADEGETQFRGELTISGTYTYYKDGDLEDSICVELDEASAAKLPISLFDERDPSICFNNDDDVPEEKYSPKGSSGSTTVTIGDYLYQFSDEDDLNLARLVDVEVAELEDLLTDNEFNLETAEVGDSVGVMTVTGVGPAQGGARTWYNAKIEFEGKAQLTGTYTYYDDDKKYKDNVCVTDLDDESGLKVPKSEGLDDVVQLFCFSNKEDAQAEFGPAGSTGEITVIVDNYILQFAEGNIWDWADLDQVVTD